MSVGATRATAWRGPLLRLALAVCCLAGPVWAYLDMPAENCTVPRLMLEMRSVGVYQVQSVDAKKGVFQFRRIESIQGAPVEQATLQPAYDCDVSPEVKLAKPGQMAVLFSDDPYGRGIAFVEGAWYVSNWDKKSGSWRIAYTATSYDLNCAFSGSPAELADACKRLLRGEDVVVTCRTKQRKPQSQPVQCSLRRPHEKKPATAPTSSPTSASATRATRPAGKDANALIACLKDSRFTVRLNAALALAEMGPSAASAVEPLEAALTDDPDVFVRRASAVALGRIGPAARHAVPALISVLRDGYEQAENLVSAEAALALTRIDPDGAAIAPVIASALNDKSAGVRTKAARAPGIIGPCARTAAPALIEALGDKEAGVRFDAVRSLARIAPDPVMAVPALAAAVKDKDRYVRESAVNSLAAIGPPALDALVAALDMKDDLAVRRCAINALYSMGDDAKPALPALERASQDVDREVRAVAREAVGRLKSK